MVSLTCSTRATGGVTLVHARLDGAGVTHRVRLANRLDGPVWPPRREGVPEAGWHGDRFETVVPADGTVAVGYASPAPPTESPLEIVERDACTGNDGRDEPRRDDTVTPSGVLRDLGDPSPPRDAVPIPVTGATDPAGAPNGPAPTPPPEPAEIPEAVSAWLDDVAARVDAAERLAAAESVPAATGALREIGSLDDAETLVRRVADDAEALAAVADRTAALADRADETDVPLETLERIA